QSHIDEVMNDDNIGVLLESRLESFEGQVGSFKAGIDCKEGPKTKKFGAVIVAMENESGIDRVKELLDVRLATPQLIEEDNKWSSAVISSRHGIYFAGDCLGKRDINQSLKDAETAVNEVQRVLNGDEELIHGPKALIDTEKCILCLACVRSCPHRAIDIDLNREAAVVTELACWGCGICAAECPSKAIGIRGFTDEQILAETAEPERIVAFCCVDSACRAADLAGTERMEYSRDVQIVQVPCAGRIDSLCILKEFERGA
ncbi:unnamed protein product, partial [marine sediment metagenome]